MVSTPFSASSSGNTISSGEYDLITGAAAWAQNTYVKSAPALNDDMAAKYGAPVYLVSGN